LLHIGFVGSPWARVGVLVLLRLAGRMTVGAFVFGDRVKKNVVQADRSRRPQVFVSVETKVWYLCRPENDARFMKPPIPIRSEFFTRTARDALSFCAARRRR